MCKQYDKFRYIGLGFPEYRFCTGVPESPARIGDSLARERERRASSRDGARARVLLSLSVVVRAARKRARVSE